MTRHTRDDWRDPTPEEIDSLVALWSKVPRNVVVQMDWTSDEGQEFLTKLRKVQMAGAAVKYVAEHLDGATVSVLHGAITHYMSGSAVKRRQNMRKRQRRREARENGNGASATEN